MIKVYDDVLNDLNYIKLKNQLTSDNFPYFFQKGVVDKDDNEVMFTHAILTEKGVWSEEKYVTNIKPILDYLKEKEGLYGLVRIRIVLQSNKNQSYKYKLHKDFPDTDAILQTAIYYLNTTNGGTYFENNEEVECVKNRLVVFPNSLPHSAIAHTDKPFRAVININYIR